MCLSGLAKCVLIIINMIFMVAAIALIVGGVLLAFVPSAVLEPAYKLVYAEYHEEAAREGYKLPSSAKELKNIPLVYNAGLALFIFGIFLFVMSAMGYCGSCCETCCSCLLLMFAFIMFALMVGEITVGSLFFITDSPLHKTLRSSLKEKIKTSYNDMSNDSFSTVINLINKYFKCCGIDSVTDFGGKPHRSCDAQYEYLGCYSKLTYLIDGNKLYCALGLSGLLLLQLVEGLLAIFVYKFSNKIAPV